MQYRVIKQTLLALSLALPFATPASRAAISVTDVVVAGTGAPYDVSYTLNTGASAAKLEVVNASSAVVRTVNLSGADLSKGPHITKWDGKVDGGGTAPAGSYTARITASASAVPAGGQALWGPVAVSSNPTPVWYPGVAVNHNVDSPAFGHIYVTDYANNTVVQFTADGRHVSTIEKDEFGSGVRSVSIGPDDRVYTLVQTDSITAGVFSMEQDGSDFKREATTTGYEYPSQLVVTGTGDNRRFYVATRGGDAVNLSVPGSDAPSTLLNGLTDPALSGTVDGIDVLDSNNDPSGHANSVTLYVRTTQGSGSPDSTVQRWDGNNADPVLATWTKAWDASSVLKLADEYTGFTVSIAPDGNVWVPVDGSNSTGITSQYIKLSKTDGSILDTINPGAENPRFAAVDSVGNVIAVTHPGTGGQIMGKNVWTFAPKDGGSTASHSSASFTYSGVVLTPIVITNGPNADAASATATITWTTDVASNSVVFYGASADALSSSVTDATLTTNHSVTIPGLAKNTPYFYQVRSAAENYASASSAVASFTTKDVMGAEIVPTVVGTTTNSASITWTTPFETNSVVRYGTSPDLLDKTATGNDGATNHSVTVTGLTAGRTYYFIAQSGSATIETTSSLQYTFATRNPDGTMARTLSTLSDFKFGHMDDVLLTGGGVTLNKKSLPNGVDDAGVPDLPSARHNATVVAYGGYLYVIGGRGPQVMSTVFYAPIHADGTVGAWKETASLPAPRFYAGHGGFGYNGYVYIVGGAEQPSSINIYSGATLMARQNPVDGTLGPWVVAGVFPGDPRPTRARGTLGVYNGKAYYVGGQNSDVTAVHADTFVGDIHPDGTVEWTTDPNTALPLGLFQPGFAAHNGRLYLWGGSEGTRPQAAAYTNTLQPDGNPGMWDFSFYTLPTGASGLDGLAGMASGELHGQLLSVGGSPDALVNSSAIITAEVLADGTMGEFQVATPVYAADNPLRDLDGAPWQGRFYVAGGRTNSGADAPLDSSAQARAAAITFADSGSYVGNGHYESTIMDLGKEEALNTLAVTATGSGVTLSTRTAGPDGKFGPWTKQGGLSVTFAAGSKARYLQFALDLTGGATAPVVSSVALNYGTPGVIPGGDARKALEIVGGLRTATQADITAMDKNGDGKITIEDVVALARS